MYLTQRLHGQSDDIREQYKLEQKIKLLKDQLHAEAKAAEAMRSNDSSTLLGSPIPEDSTSSCKNVGELRDVLDVVRSSTAG